MGLAALAALAAEGTLNCGSVSSHRVYAESTCRGPASRNGALPTGRGRCLPDAVHLVFR